MAHLMPCIPKSEFQVASGVSSCASAGAATTVSSGLSETSDGLGWSKMINKSWTGTASSIHLESIKCFVRFIGWWCYKIRTPENQKSWNIYLKKTSNKIFKHIQTISSHAQHSKIKAPRNIRWFHRCIGWFFCRPLLLFCSLRRPERLRIIVWEVVKAFCGNPKNHCWYKIKTHGPMYYGGNRQGNPKHRHNPSLGPQVNNPRNRFLCFIGCCLCSGPLPLVWNLRMLELILF